LSSRNGRSSGFAVDNRLAISAVALTLASRVTFYQAIVHPALDVLGNAVLTGAVR